MKKSGHVIFLSLLLIVLLAEGCATAPTGPSVMVLPAPGKPFDQFQMEDAYCRQWASQQAGQSPSDASTNSTLTGAGVGTLVGAGLGAAIGAAAGNAGTGAAIGAGSGLLVGTATGASAGQTSAYEAQHRYDNAYMQCMYSKGNQIPGAVAPAPHVRRTPPPPPPPDYHSVPPDYQTPPPPAR